MTDRKPQVDEAAQLVRVGLRTVVAEAMLSDIDVTDDVLFDAATSFLQRFAVPVAKRSADVATILAAATPPQLLSWVRAFAVALRKMAATSVGGALDADSGAAEASMAQLTLAEFQKHGFDSVDARLMTALAQSLASSYASLCRRSRMRGEDWVRYFFRRVDAGQWATRGRG